MQRAPGLPRRHLRAGATRPVPPPLSCHQAGAPSPGLIPSRDRIDWLSRHVLPHEPALRAWLRRRAVPGLEIDDVVQETYSVLSGLASVEHIQAPRAYA